MGTWDSELFSNDTTLDIKDTYLGLLKQQLSNEVAYERTCESYAELIGTDEEPIFWYALADIQWNVGRLMPQVKDTAMMFIEKKGGISSWVDSPENALKWETTLQLLKNKIEKPMPPEKKFKKERKFIQNPWEIGDVYAYQFHTKGSVKYDVYGKYILFQKVGNVEYYENTIFSIVQVYDCIFDSPPSINELDSIDILPLVNPITTNSYSNNTLSDCINDYIPSFNWYLKATMIYEKQSHYPKKYFVYIGNKYIQETKYEANDFTDFFLEKDGMEDWLIEYFINWKKIDRNVL